MGQQGQGSKAEKEARRKPSPLSGWGLVKRSPGKGRGGAAGGGAGMDSRLALVLAGSGGLLLGLLAGRYWGWLGKLKVYHQKPGEEPKKKKGQSSLRGPSAPIEQMASQYDEYKMVRNPSRGGCSPFLREIHTGHHHRWFTVAW